MYLEEDIEEDGLVPGRDLPQTHKDVQPTEDDVGNLGGETHKWHKIGGISQ